MEITLTVRLCLLAALLALVAVPAHADLTGYEPPPLDVVVFNFDVTGVDCTNSPCSFAITEAQQNDSAAAGNPQSFMYLFDFFGLNYNDARLYEDTIDGTLVFRRRSRKYLQQPSGVPEPGSEGWMAGGIALLAALYKRTRLLEK